MALIGPKAWWWLGWLMWVGLTGMNQDAIEASEECLDCHDDVGEVLAPTVHNHEVKVSCIDCHGTSAAHIDDPDTGKIDNGKTAAAMTRCANCHKSDIHKQRPGKSVHAAAEVSCANCHMIHPAKPEPGPALLAAAALDLCLSCHQDVASQLAKPYNHKLLNGVITCASCHDPHGGRGRKSFKRRNLTATCANCHPETLGPFVYSHVNGVSGDCMSCHEAHGSANPRQLIRSDVDQICLECHSTLPAGNLGSQPPSAHNLRVTRYQNCTVCHTAVHGSSRSPLLLK